MVLTERERVRQTRDERAEARKLAEEREARYFYFEDLLAGKSEETALLNFIRRGNKGSGRVATRTFAHWLYEHDTAEKKNIGAIAIGVFLVGDELFEAALKYFEVAGMQKSWSAAPKEVLSAKLGVQGKDSLPEFKNWLSKVDFRTDAECIYEIIKVLSQFGFYDEARSICERLTSEKSNLNQLSSEQIKDIEWISQRLINSYSENKIDDNDEFINIAVMDYKLIDRQRTSSNRGDYVQTLASLSNILRFEDVEFVGETKLDLYLNELKNNIHESHKVKLGKPKVKSRAFTLDRDFSSGRQYPPNTWLLCNGWFMHRNFKGTIDFPFPDAINPIFISFHVNDPAVLTEDVATNLKKFEPIGCRDWTTVYRLREFGVKCFFSGCLTTTISQILPSTQNQDIRRLALVESRIASNQVENWDVEEFSQVGDYVREFDLVDGIKDADEMLRGYLPFGKIKTSRLHCYLPCRSMGFDVDFAPRNRSDVRFEGLLDLSKDEFQNIRSGIEAKLKAVYAAIFEGKSKETVMQVWKDICHDDVVATERVVNEYPPVPSSSDEVAEFVKQIKISGTQQENSNAIHVAFATDANLMGYFPVVLKSALMHASRPLVVHLMYRNLPSDYLDGLKHAFSKVSFRFYDMSEVDYGERLRMLSHTTVSTMDRCLLPEIIPDQSKVIYLDIDILVRADLSELFDIKLEDHLVAGKLSNLKTWNLVTKLATRGSLYLEPQEAWNLRRRLHSEHSLYRTSFNAGIIVMNLDKMREQLFSMHALHLISSCHLNDQDALNIMGASNVYELAPEWNYVPAQDYCEDPKIIHWAGVVKAWDTKPILWKSEFIEVANITPEVQNYTFRG
ncbi:glycosyltransferase family 8 protein [Pseudovibrio brasiliensis]|uniref:Glycosyltransferase family 8 protein n=1 Tax=Pseudovibrio brasiliensis TaxID=1898042 RepID=A0ABX8ALJ4_9HYPH|nr:glycosyltransferase family 8 protein [Pseudovibrio brasiliensis]QUS55953.1 glycosyltransferase family 8 protein [Pseudovibrio brasiliensis]